MHFRLDRVAWMVSGLGLFMPSGLGQTVDHVDVFRDAVVVTWKAEVRAGECLLARSFHASEDVDVMVFDDAGVSERGAVASARSDWYPSGGDAEWNALDSEWKEAQWDLEMKGAQAQLVEDDLALLRANRKVGGTSEAMLVEDLSEVAHWMHEETKDLLYRRIELMAEIKSMEEEMARLEERRQAAKPVPVWEWSVEMPTGSEGTLWTQVAERGAGMGWSPADVLELGGASPGQLNWSQRALVFIDVPAENAPVPVRLHDARYAGLDARPDARPDLLMATYDKRAAGAYSVSSDAGTSAIFPGVSWEMEELAVGPGWKKNVRYAVQDIPADVRFFSVPKQSPVVNMRLALPRPPAPVAEMDRAALILSGRPAGKVWVTERGDSLLIDAGAVRSWTVNRAREAALCSKSILGNRIKHHRAYTITASNRSGVSGELVLEEPLPVSRNAEIEVVPESLDGGILDEAQGIVRWKFVLAPGESRTLRFAYDLSHSRDVAIPDWD